MLLSDFPYHGRLASHFLRFRRRPAGYGTGPLRLLGGGSGSRRTDSHLGILPRSLHRHRRSGHAAHDGPGPPAARLGQPVGALPRQETVVSGAHDGAALRTLPRRDAPRPPPAIQTRRGQLQFLHGDRTTAGGRRHTAALRHHRGRRRREAPQTGAGPVPAGRRPARRRHGPGAGGFRRRNRQRKGRRLRSPRRPPPRRSGRLAARATHVGQASRPVQSVAVLDRPGGLSYCRILSRKGLLLSPIQPKKKPASHLRSALPLLQELVRPRRGKIAFGFLLMLIGRLCSLVLPGAPKYLIDNVINQHQISLLKWIVGAVFAATIIQGITSFSLTQLLSKEGQRLIAELRRKVQEHIGRLPVAYYDANKSGALVSRIMSDVEGVRNLIGTGLVEFFGGILTALLSLAILIRISAQLTGIALFFIVVCALGLGMAFGKIRPIFRERGKINADVTGRLTESLAGVRVVKGYHAEAGEARVFTAGVQRLLDNVMRSLTAISLMTLSATMVMGVVGGTVMYIGARQILATPPTLTIGGLFSFVLYLAFLVAPVLQMVSIGTQLTEALAGLDRTQEVLAERPEDEDAKRVRKIDTLQGYIAFDNVTFEYDPGKHVD